MPGRPWLSYLQDGLYARSEIKTLFGVSYATVMRWEKEGKFGEPTPNELDPKRTFYAKANVEKFYATWRPRAGAFEKQLAMKQDNTIGKLTAHIFRLMKEQKTFADIVIEVEAPATTVRKIMDEYDKDHTYLRKLEQETELQKRQREDEIELKRSKRQDKYWENRTEFELSKIKTEAKQKARSTESNAPKSRVQMPEFLTKKS